MRRRAGGQINLLILTGQNLVQISFQQLLGEQNAAHQPDFIGFRRRAEPAGQHQGGSALIAGKPCSNLLAAGIYHSGTIIP